MARVLLLTLVPWFALLFCFNGVKASNTNFEVKRYELCNNTQGRLKYYGNITKENGQQYLDLNMTTPVPWDDNLGGSCLIETKSFGDNYVELFTVNNKNICKSFNKYLGEFWYDIQRAAQLPTGVCPIQAGRYHVHHLQLNFNKLSLQTFPFGMLRFTMKAVDNHNKKENMWCILIEVENVPN